MKCLLVLLALLIALPAPAKTPSKARAESAKAGASKSGNIDSAYKTIEWDELVPKNWDPAKPFRQLDLASMQDNDARAIRVLELMKKEWDNAPVEPALDGRKVRIPGFVVPIEEGGRAVTEFLLVPYFGACIHVPPPPANQIIHVVSAKPIPRLRVMDAVWVAGELKLARYAQPTAMGMGASGYRINSVAVTPYKEPAMVTITPSR